MSEQQFSWMTEYPDGTVGAVGAMMPGLGHVPMHFRDRDTAMQFKPVALSHRRQTGQRVWLRIWTAHIDEKDLK